MAAVDVVHVANSLGGRTPIDLGQPTLDLQQLGDPQVSLFEITTRYGPQTVRRIFEKLEEREQEQPYAEVNLGDNRLGDEGAAYLYKGLAGSPILKRLNLLRTGLSVEGFMSIGKLLGESQSLEELLLGGNEAGEGACSGEFSAGLAKNRSIKSLTISHNRLGNDGIKELCEGPLKNHPTLEHIGLSYNRLDAGAVSLLAPALKNNKALRHLDLGGNSLGPEGAEQLVQAMKGNSGRIKRLSVDRNSIQPRGALALCRLFGSKEGGELEYLDVRYNRIGNRTCEQIRQELGQPDADCVLLLGDQKQRQLFIGGL